MPLHNQGADRGLSLRMLLRQMERQTVGQHLRCATVRAGRNHVRVLSCPFCGATTHEYPAGATPGSADGVKLAKCGRGPLDCVEIDSPGVDET